MSASIGWYVVSWYGPLHPVGDVPGIIRGIHDETTAKRQADWWDAHLTEKSGGLAFYARAFTADEAHKTFKLMA